MNVLPTGNHRPSFRSAPHGVAVKSHVTDLAAGFRFRPCIAALLLVLSSLWVAGCGSGPKSSTTIYFGAQNTTATVLGVGASEEESRVGRGAIVDDGIMATACHVVADTQPYVVLNNYQEAEIVAKAADLCLLGFESRWAGNRPIDFASTRDMDRSAPIYLIGSLSREDTAFMEGEILGLQRDRTGLSPNGIVLVYKADLAHGASGGPVLDQKGRLLGITVAKNNGVVAAIPVEAVETLLEQ